ncbi:acyl-CoA thioesterase domain-containing protein [Mycolicibacterium baixiangningiae]|uniref:acyl-CoA thioesterase domain-containing protein n=1 Tax=Mycolicibacterium baixiangningiae TaxID=2761578 RepID=UPI00186653F6|nr:acyl-CoA thioesterase domain-containing protein [Mycolicibacterium baixiangningiae]
MSEQPVHFEPTADGAFLPTRFAQSHWGEDHLNGPAIVGLAAVVLEQEYGREEFLPSRLTVDLFKAARGVPTTVKTNLVRDGRRVRNSECELVQDGVTVAHATLVQYRRAEAPRGTEWTPPGEFAVPTEVDPSRAIHVSSDGQGWTNEIADHQNAARKRTWGRSIQVVAGTDNSAFVRAAVIAEGTSLVTNLGTAGVGYINGDLTVALVRLPVDDWIGVQAETHWAADGISVGTSTLYDRAGAFGSGMVTAVSNAAVQVDFGNDPFPSRTH